MSLSLLHHIRQSRDLSILNIHDEGLVAKVYVIVVFFAGSTAHKKLSGMQMNNLGPVFFEIKNLLLFLEKRLLLLIEHLRCIVPLQLILSWRYFIKGSWHILLKKQHCILLLGLGNPEAVQITLGLSIILAVTRNHILIHLLTQQLHFQYIARVQVVKNGTDGPRVNQVVGEHAQVNVTLIAHSFRINLLNIAYLPLLVY